MVFLGGGTVSYERGTPVRRVGWRVKGAHGVRNLSHRAIRRGTSLMRKRTPLGPYRVPMPRVLGGSYILNSKYM